MTPRTFAAAVLLTLAAVSAAQGQPDFGGNGLSAESIAAIQLELAELAKAAPPVEKIGMVEKPKANPSEGGAIFSPFVESAVRGARSEMPAATKAKGDEPDFLFTMIVLLAGAIVLTWLLRKA